MLDEYEPDSFCHHLGHGIGLGVHEAPRLNPHWADTLEPGDVFTVEPGLYYTGLGGVRIEDLVIIETDGYRNVTTFPKTLQL